MKILIIGANGFLGKNMLTLKSIEQFHEENLKFLAADVARQNIPKKIPFFNIDITNYNQTLNQLKKSTPDFVLLTAAMTDVDQCEIEKDLARNINTKGPINVLKSCEEIDAKFVFLSTDFVFDGISKDYNYSENDSPNPLSYYAKTKFEAEQAILNSKIDYLICRTAVLYGWNKQKLNYITWIIKKLEQGESISIVTSQINNPTFVRNLAQILIKLIEKDAIGTYHTAGSESLSRYMMAIKTAEIFNLNKDLIRPIEQFKQKAIRPKNAALDISKMKKIISSELKNFSLDEGLNYMKNHKP